MGRKFGRDRVNGVISIKSKAEIMRLDMAANTVVTIKLSCRIGDSRFVLCSFLFDI